MLQQGSYLAHGDEEQLNANGEAQASDSQSTFAPPTMKELQLGVEQHLLGAELNDQLSPITAQLYATSLWANHNGLEEDNGNEASLLLANQERGVAESNNPGDLSCDHKQEAASPDSVSR
ncbi:hypothetical protein CesoFtcFv8_021459 [Champsocephalus esox]|uniref:Uncharacterized protein n=1 Tax=Champsocephalus esox TaxID=159716 RepID=A0AAN8GL06_9TELE|nr:hypothetical protein CesoFtcFv8_021459 [Champsocephalus esox]